VDLQKCEEYIESAKHAILRTSRQMEGHLATLTANVTITDAHDAAAMVAPITPMCHSNVAPNQTGAIFWRYRDMGLLLGAV
jgi:hypothetical protein